MWNRKSLREALEDSRTEGIESLDVATRAAAIEQVVADGFRSGKRDPAFPAGVTLALQILEEDLGIAPLASA